MIRRPLFWVFAFLLWILTTWWLSSRVLEFPEGLSFRASNKLLHGGWFFGGAGLLSAAFYLSRPCWSIQRHLLVVVAVLVALGAADEFHQSFVPGRSGNDPLDLLADTLGAFLGSLVFHPLRRLLGS